MGETEFIYIVLLFLHIHIANIQKVTAPKLITPQLAWLNKYTKLNEVSNQAKVLDSFPK